jgi:cytochrome P450
MTDSKVMPLLRGKTVVQGYDDCQGVLVQRHAFEVGAFEPYSAPVWGGSLPISNDPTHLPRRRYIATLLSRSAMTRYDKEFLQQAIEEFLSQGRASEDDHVDLIALVRLMLVRVAATIIGIDGVRDDESRARQLMSCIDGFISGTQVRYSTRVPEEVIAEALAAVKLYADELYEPSRRRRQELAADVAAGRRLENELPDDLIMRQQLPGSNERWTEETAMRDTLSIFAGGLQTTAVAIAQSIDEYFAWEGRDAAPTNDPELIRGVVNETLRLRPPVPYILRRAAIDVTLRSGRAVAAGTDLALDLTAANRDPAVFGPDAEEFAPERYKQLPPQYPQYGLAFGAGSHVCYGKPLATVAGTDPRDTHVPRVITHVVAALLEAGVRPADVAPVKEASYRDIFRTYPVMFPQLADLPTG